MPSCAKPQSIAAQRTVACLRKGPRAVKPLFSPAVMSSQISKTFRVDPAEKNYFFRGEKRSDRIISAAARTPRTRIFSTRLGLIYRGFAGPCLKRCWRG